MALNRHGGFVIDVGSLGASPRTDRIRESVLEGLTQEFGGAVLKADALGANPDLVLKFPNAVALVDIKTGDPSLSLPSSTDARMALLTRAVQPSHAGKKLVPIVVTNYQVFPAQKAALEASGIKIVSIDTGFDSKKIAEDVVQAINAYQF